MTEYGTILSMWREDYRHIRVCELEVVHPDKDNIYMTTRDDLTMIRERVFRFWGINIPTWDSRTRGRPVVQRTV